jgi:Cys-tRNA(Pro)/Cys-tRNA(Cys) deacylase
MTAETRALHPRVAQALRDAQVAYEVRWHAECDRPIHSPADFAAALGYPIGRIAKTLLVASPGDRRLAAIVMSVDARLDGRAAGAALGLGRMEIATADELAAATGYPRTGVSPLGLTDAVPVIIDEGLTGYATVLIGGGVLGGEVELTPEDLRLAAHATVVRVTR